MSKDAAGRSRRAQSGEAALDSGVSSGCILGWTFRTGMDVDLAPWSAHPQQRIPDARNRTQPRMGGRRSRSGDRLHRGTGTWSEVYFGPKVAGAQF